MICYAKIELFSGGTAGGIPVPDCQKRKLPSVYGRLIVHHELRRVLPGGRGCFLAMFPQGRVLHDIFHDRILIARGCDGPEDFMLPFRRKGDPDHRGRDLDQLEDGPDLLHGPGQEISSLYLLRSSFFQEPESRKGITKKTGYLSLPVYLYDMARFGSLCRSAWY